MDTRTIKLSVLNLVYMLPISSLYFVRVGVHQIFTSQTTLKGDTTFTEPLQEALISAKRWKHISMILTRAKRKEGNKSMPI